VCAALLALAAGPARADSGRGSWAQVWADSEWKQRVALLGALDRRGDAAKLDLRWQPELSAPLPGGWRGTAIGRLLFDAVDELEPGVPRLGSYARGARPLTLGTRLELELRELYVDGELGPGQLRLGKQQVVWGKADGLRVLDVVDPQDFREFVLDDLENARIPLWTAALELPLAGGSLQLLWVPDTTVYELPERGGRFEFTSPRLIPRAPRGVPIRIASARRPRRALRDGDGGARYSAFVGGWDVTLNYLYHYDDQPVVEREYASIDGRPALRVFPAHYRLQTAGGSFSTAFADLTVRGEFAYTQGRRVSTRLARDLDGLVRTREFASVLALDWFGVSRGLLSAQLFHVWQPAPGRELIAERSRAIATFLARRSFLNERLQLEAMWLQGLRGDGRLLRGRIAYDLSDQLRVVLGIDLFSGSRRGLFGEFGAQDRITLGVEWSR
jgi:hypothetical protein